MPKDVTIHRTPITRAESLFINQAGLILKPSYFIREPEHIKENTEEGGEEADKVYDMTEELSAN